MKTVVAVDFRVGPSSPGFISFTDRHSFVGNGEVDEGCRSSSDSRFRSCVEVVFGVGSHEGKLHVGVGVDTSRNDQLVRAVDNFCTFMGQIAGDGSDLPLLDKDVSIDGDVGVDNSGIFQEVGAEISEDGSVDKFVHV